MSFGGWVSGVIFDATGSYAAAFLNGLGWNALNIVIIVSLLIRARQRPPCGHRRSITLDLCEFMLRIARATTTKLACKRSTEKARG
jgi:hypothetical protein